MEGEPSGKTSEDPETWAGLLAAYRQAPAQRWSSLLLERLGPWLNAARRQLKAAPPYLDSEDISQMLVAEVLRIASRWRPGCEDHWVPRRLVERAARSVGRTLLREALNHADQLSADIEGGGPSEPDLVFDTPVGRATARDLRVIYRARVLREPIESIAADAGISVPEITLQLAAALRRARAGKDQG